MASLHILLFLFSLGFFQVSIAQLPDVTVSGNYVIRNCDAGQAGSRASDLQTILPRIHETLQAVIADTELGTNSRHGFETFFHSNDTIPYVSSIFKKIAAGNAVRLRHEDPALDSKHYIGLPTIVCIELEDEAGRSETGALSIFCRENPNMHAFRQGKYVALCPLFWEMDEEPQSMDCPRVRRNTLTANDNSLAISQQALLVHELAHVYGVLHLDHYREMRIEAYNLADVAWLNQETALRNAQNYAFYYAGEWFR